MRHALKHKKEEISLSDLAQHLAVEASIRAHESQRRENPNVSTVNIVEDEGKASSGDKRKKHTSFNGKSNYAKKTIDNGCWECGKLRHRKKNCYVFESKQKKAKGQASSSKDTPTKGDLSTLSTLNKNFFLDFSSIDSNLNVV